MHLGFRGAVVAHGGLGAGVVTAARLGPAAWLPVGRRGRATVGVLAVATWAEVAPAWSGRAEVGWLQQF